MHVFMPEHNTNVEQEGLRFESIDAFSYLIGCAVYIHACMYTTHYYIYIYSTTN